MLTLKYLKEEEKPPTKELGGYLLRYLPCRLHCLEELEQKGDGSLLPADKLEIGLGLYRIFTDSAIVERHQASFERALWGEEDMKTMGRWLTDSSVVMKIRDSEWKDMCRFQNPSDGFLKEWANQITHQFLRSRVWQAEAACAWVHELISVVSNFYPFVLEVRLVLEGF